MAESQNKLNHLQPRNAVKSRTLMSRYIVALVTAVCLIGGVWIYLLQAAALKFRHVRGAFGRAAEFSSDEQLKLQIADLLLKQPLVWVFGIFGFCLAIAFLLGVPVVEIRGSDPGAVKTNAPLT